MKAKGQKQLVDACPYGHIWWNEELQIPQHHLFFSLRLRGGPGVVSFAGQVAHYKVGTEKPLTLTQST